MRVSRPGIIVAGLPGLLMLALFYSLVLHMYHSLGGWPRGIGEYGFSPSLLAHANVTVYSFGVLILLGIFIWPLAILLCAVVPRWRRVIPYLALYAAVFLICWGLMQLAPEQFLYWWRD
jgi:hypothetical protein